MIDTHTHSHFSHDGCQSIEALVNEAKQKKLSYLAITDHCDWDYLTCSEFREIPQLDLQNYLKTIEKVKSQVKGIELAIGLELGFHKNASENYKNNIPFDRLDYVINSVHSIGYQDVYFPDFFSNKSKKESYKQYLLGILESISAPYPYNTIGHIGFIAKNSIYQEKVLKYSDFTDLVDEILKGIIKRDKTLELNANIKTDVCMPNQSIIKRYLELGGENVVYASDAHNTQRIGDKYNVIKELALSLGIKYWTIYSKMQPKKITIT